MKKLWHSALLAALAFSPIYSFADSIVEDIIARVNDQIITTSQFKHSREQTLAELRQQYGSEADARFTEHEKDLLRDLIDQQLLLQRGKAAGVTADTELVKRLDELRKQMNLESMDDLEKEAQKQGVSFEDFKQGIRNNIITQQVIGREVGSHIQIAQQDLQKFYKEHKQEFEQPEGVRLSELLVSIDKVPFPKPQTPAPASGNFVSGRFGEQPTNPLEEADHITAARKKAEQLREAIQKGAKFADTAKASSDGPTAAQGGDLGYFKRGQLAKELEDKVFAMKPGEVSDVVRTKQGFIVLKVTDHTDPGVAPLKQIEPQVQESIYLEKLQPALRAFLTKLREEAYIDIKPGYTDTGASSNQTKPIFTTAAADTKTKKKRHKKLGVF